MLARRPIGRRAFSAVHGQISGGGTLGTLEWTSTARSADERGRPTPCSRRTRTARPRTASTSGQYPGRPYARRRDPYARAYGATRTPRRTGEPAMPPAYATTRATAPTPARHGTRAAGRTDAARALAAAAGRATVAAAVAFAALVGGVGLRRRAQPDHERRRFEPGAARLRQRRIGGTEPAATAPAAARQRLDRHDQHDHGDRRAAGRRRRHRHRARLPAGARRRHRHRADLRRRDPHQQPRRRRRHEHLGHRRLDRQDLHGARSSAPTRRRTSR